MYLIYRGRLGEREEGAGRVERLGGPSDPFGGYKSLDHSGANTYAKSYENRAGQAAHEASEAPGHPQDRHPSPQDSSHQT